MKKKKKKGQNKKKKLFSMLPKISVNFCFPHHAGCEFANAIKKPIKITNFIEQNKNLNVAKLSVRFFKCKLQGLLLTKHIRMKEKENLNFTQLNLQMLKDKQQLKKEFVRIREERKKITK
jgi:hypothetical protein